MAHGHLASPLVPQSSWYRALSRYPPHFSFLTAWRSPELLPLVIILLTSGNNRRCRDVGDLVLCVASPSTLSPSISQKSKFVFGWYPSSPGYMRCVSILRSRDPPFGPTYMFPGYSGVNPVPRNNLKLR